MIHSFRLRLALNSALLAGLVLAAFGFGSLWLIRKIQTEKIDNELRFYAERMAARPRDANGWQFAEGELAIRLRIVNRDDLLLVVQSVSGEPVFQSSQWPGGLSVNQLAWPTPAPAQQGELSFWPTAYAASPPNNGPILLAQAGGAGRNRPPVNQPGPPPGAPAGPEPFPGFIPNTSGELPMDAPPNKDRSGGPGEFSVPGNSPPRDRQPVVIPQTPAPASASSAPPPSSVMESAPPLLFNGPSGDHPPPLRLEPLPPLPAGPLPTSATQVLTAGQEQWRIGLAATDQVRIAIAVNAGFIDADLRSTRNAFLLALPVALALIGAGSWTFSGRALQPVKKLTEVTRRVNAEGLNQRISAKGEDQEFAGLIDVFNSMLARLDRSFQQAHRFSADAAHELKTPLAIVQGQLERAIGQAEVGSALQRDLTSILDEVQRLSTISRKLLLLSQADSGRLNVFNAPIDLSSTLQDLIEDTRMLAPDLDVMGTIPNGLMVEGDASLLRQVLHNLISNAIKYNQAPASAPGWIRISTAQWSGRLEVEISNSSAGIPAALRDKIFERFFRADTAHSRSIEGVGLGLSVSREIARAHGGELTLKSDVRSGLPDQVSFSLLLPARQRQVKP